MKTKRNKGLSKRELFLLSLLLITAVVSICWYFYGFKLYSDIKSHKNELYALETDIERFNILHSEQTVIEDQWLELESLSNELIIVLPSEEDLPQVLERLETTITPYWQLINSFTIAELYPGDNVSTADISISATGPANRLKRLLYELENFPHSLVFKSINWAHNEAGQATAGIELRLFLYQNTGLHETVKEIEVP